MFIPAAASATLALRTVTILFFPIQYNTDISALIISWYRYQSDSRTVWLKHTFISYFVMWSVGKAASSERTQTENTRILPQNGLLFIGTLISEKSDEVWYNSILFFLADTGTILISHWGSPTRIHMTHNWCVFTFTCVPVFVLLLVQAEHVILPLFRGWQRPVCVVCAKLWGYLKRTVRPPWWEFWRKLISCFLITTEITYSVINSYTGLTIYHAVRLVE